MKNKMSPVKGETMPGLNGKGSAILPTFTLSEKDLPDIKGWKVGGKYTLCVEVEMTKSMQGSEYQMPGSTADKSVKGTFKVVSVGVEENDDSEMPSKDPKKNEDFENEYAAKRSAAASMK